MKIMSFNTQHCRNFMESKIDFQLMADTILQCGADIVGLNEMFDTGINPEYNKQVSVLSELTGIKHHYFARAITFENGNVYGNGFLSKYPILSAETIIIPDPDPKTGDGYYETRCLLKAKLEGGITVLVSHFGLNHDERESAVKTVLEHLEEEKCILMGDFNAQPEDTVLNPIRERMTDTADWFTGPHLSFPSDSPCEKIDYIFVSRDIEVVTADIPAIVASDHRPHTAEIHI